MQTLWNKKFESFLNHLVSKATLEIFWKNAYRRKDYMSFDEKQHLDNDEIDLVELFRSIWFYKFILLIFIILSVPMSVMFSSLS